MQIGSHVTMVPPQLCSPAVKVMVSLPSPPMWTTVWSPVVAAALSSPCGCEEEEEEESPGVEL